MDTNYKDPISGIPLTVVDYAYNEDNFVMVVDPDGVTMEIPREWIDHPIETSDEFDHTAIHAPPGELERIWHESAEAQRPMDPELGGFGEGAPFESVYDKWKKEESGYQQEAEAAKGWKPGDPMLPSFYGGVPGAVEKMEAAKAQLPEVSSTLTKPWFARKPQPGPTMRKEDIPADAGSGWGNPDEVWNPKTQRWEKRR